MNLDDTQEILARVDSPLHTETLDVGKVLMVWGTALGWHIQIYRPAIGQDNGAVLAGRTVNTPGTTKDQVIQLGRTLTP